MLPSAVCATLLLATAAPAAGSEGEQVYDRLVRSTVLITTDRGLGSGVLIHRAKRIIVTNSHVVRDARELHVLFAIWAPNGTLVTDCDQYLGRLRKAVQMQGGPNFARRAELLADDPTHDLALLRLGSVPDTARSIRLSEKPATPGSRVFVIGNSGVEDHSNQLWRFTTGFVRGRSGQMISLRRNDQTRCQVLESDAPTNSGDSGSPVVNEECRVVGIHSFSRKDKRSVSGHIDVEEVRKFLRAEVPDIDWP